MQGVSMRNMREQHAHKDHVHELMGMGTQDESMRMLDAY